MPAKIEVRQLVLVLSLLIGAQALKLAANESHGNPPNSRSGALEDLTITRMLFTYSDPDSSATSTVIKICSDDTPPDTPTDTEVTVIFGTSDTQEQAVEGILVEDESNCAQFEMAYRVPEIGVATTYTFIVRDPDTVKTSTSTFTMTENILVLSCAEKNLIRVSWTDPTTTIVNDCIAPLPSVSTQLCYIEGYQITEDICFETTDADGIEICRNGGFDVVEEASEVSVNYLAYDPSTDDTAQLSLTFDGNTERSLEVTLWGDAAQSPTILVCDGCPCSLASFAPSDTLYEMCAFFNPLTGPQSGYTNVEDIKLAAYDMAEDSLFIEFGFTNLNEGSFRYIASLSVGPPELTPTGDSVHLDCTGVAATHTCYGFISSEQVTSSDVSYLNIEYTDEAFEVLNNKIVAKVQELPSGGGDLGRLRGPSYNAVGNEPYANIAA